MKRQCAPTQRTNGFLPTLTRRPPRSYRPTRHRQRPRALYGCILVIRCTRAHGRPDEDGLHSRRAATNGRGCPEERQGRDLRNHGCCQTPSWKLDQEALEGCRASHRQSAGSGAGRRGRPEDDVAHRHRQCGSGGTRTPPRAYLRACDSNIRDRRNATAYASWCIRPGQERQGTPANSGKSPCNRSARSGPKDRRVRAQRDRRSHGPGTATATWPDGRRCALGGSVLHTQAVDDASRRGRGYERHRSCEVGRLLLIGLNPTVG